MHAQAMINTHPAGRTRDLDALVRCVEACFDCAQCCTACADACLGEDMVAELRACIRLNLDCAGICAATGAIASRQTFTNEAVLGVALEACAEICPACAAECRQHSERHEHCRVCAEACEDCDQACLHAIQSAGVH
jgi:hypothetical protein